MPTRPTRAVIFDSWAKVYSTLVAEDYDTSQFPFTWLDYHNETLYIGLHRYEINILANKLNSYQDNKLYHAS